MALWLAIGAMAPQSDATLYGQIVLGVVVAVQIALQIYARVQDRKDREQQRQFEKEDREQKAADVKAALKEQAEKVEKTALQQAEALTQKIERNTEITERGFHETNNYKQREQEWMALFAKLASPAEAAQASKVEDIKRTGEDTNERVKDIEAKADEVADALRQKESGR